MRVGIELTILGSIEWESNSRLLLTRFFILPWVCAMNNSLSEFPKLLIMLTNNPSTELQCRSWVRVNFIISYSHMWWHFINQLFWGQTANLIQPFLLVNEVGGAQWKNFISSQVFHHDFLLGVFWFFIAYFYLPNNVSLSALPCPHLYLNMNGSITQCSKEPVYGETCVLKCPEGYKLSGSRSRTCELSHHDFTVYWTGTNGVCKSKLVYLLMN